MYLEIILFGFAFFILIGFIANVQEKSKRKKERKYIKKQEIKLAAAERIKQQTYPIKHSKQLETESTRNAKEIEERNKQEELKKTFLKKEKAEKAKLRREENFIKKYNEAVLLLKKNMLLPLGANVEKTGDEKRYKDFLAECKQTHTQEKYLYLVKIKSNIDDKKFIKIGITSYKDINKRFEDDDVIELKEVIRSIKFDTRVAMAIEFNLIQKHRPKDYFAEKEFDVFSRFDGYTEVIPMRYTKAITKDIDLFEKESQLFTDAFDVISKVKKELKLNISLWSDLHYL